MRNDMEFAMKTSPSIGAKLHKTWRQNHSTVILRDQFLTFGFIWLEDKKQLANKRKKENTQRKQRANFSPGSVAQ